MNGYGGMGHYYVNRAQHYDKRCPKCLGSKNERVHGIDMECSTCNGTGLRPDPKVPRANAIAAGLILLSAIVIIVGILLTRQL